MHSNITHLNLVSIQPSSNMSESAVAALEEASLDAPQTKSAAKKEAKRQEKLAKLAAKSSKPVPSAGGSKKKTPAAKIANEEEVFVNTTPQGEKKDLSQPMASGYNPEAVESAWYDWWEAQGFFLPRLTPQGRPVSKDVFVIPCPPPNVTGSLHIGHALTTAIQDGLIRWTTLFVPGFDHAGISTQSVVENRFTEPQNEYQARITNQLRRLGGSYDWTRTAFTMDERLSKAVVETFCLLHEDGIIYRANRLVNWCVKMNTTLSNLEVEAVTIPGRTLLNVPGYEAKEKFEFGVMVSFAYPIENSDDRIIVATTRPETMVGDTAIAVHPDDPRYTKYHGKFAVHPFLNRRLPIVTDTYVDMEKGTGAVKITPAHDENDYGIGKRHNLEFINILNDDGTFNENAGERFKGMKRYHARVAVVQALKDAGLYIETKDNPMEIRICSKSGDIIEPVLKPQWYVNCAPLAEEAIKRTRAGELRITPQQSENEWYRWLEGIQDWCISRQLWWDTDVPLTSCESRARIKT
ncbi:Valine--tRNA ligase [Grifola frondosa]|uniref:valine--tRNA ligase n=1 Tax=Grifola frondosa TaxID=5627 RepID=A0A1C7M122_GRIFR|nr:Valine--tRNA ligase [Grifola frondosa]